MASAKSKKVRNVSKGPPGPEERTYDVSRGQNRFVTLPLLFFIISINLYLSRTTAFGVKVGGSFS